MGSAWRDKAGSLFTAEKQEAVASRGMVAANHPLAAAAGLVDVEVTIIRMWPSASGHDSRFGHSQVGFPS